MKKKAFSLIEIVIVLAIFISIMAILIPYGLARFNITRVETVASDLSSKIYTYQQFAYTGKNGKNYGIAFETDKYIPFIGNSYATAESSFEINLPNLYTIDMSGVGANEIVFNSGSFRPDEYGTIIITNPNGTDYIVEINAEGLVSYYVSEEV